MIGNIVKMIILTIDNSYCNIAGLSIQQEKQLKELLSYAINAQQAYFGGGFRSTKRCLMDKKGNFPSGLKYIVKNYLKSVKYSSRDLRIRPQMAPDRFSTVFPCSPYPEQEEAVVEAIKYESGCIVMPTGCGKSIAMALLVKNFGLKTLIIVPNLELKRQLTETFTKIFGDLTDITIENIGSNRLDRANDYNLLIIDEAHHSGAKTYRQLNKKSWTNIYHRYHFTATPFRSKDEEQLLMESITGEVVYRVDYQTAVNKGYVVPVEAYYYELPTIKPKGNTNSWPSMYSELVVNNMTRNALIGNIIDQLEETKTSTLCLVKEIKHGENLKELTGLYFANGFNEYTPHLISEFNAGHHKVLLGTTGVIGEGVDSRPAEFVIVAGLGRSKNSFMQACGRGMRRHGDKVSCKVIIFKDASHRWTLAHFRAQCKILKEEYGCIPVKLQPPVLLDKADSI